MVSDAVLRSTGFPYELVERLRLPVAASAAAAVAGAERELLSLAVRTGWEESRLAHLRAVVAAGTVRLGPEERADPHWVDAVTRLRAARRALDEVVAKEEAAAATVAELARDDRLREALAVSNPRILADLERRGHTAQLTHQLATFIQRVCTKNETLSFFGPINYATLDERDPDAIALSSRGPGTLRARRAHTGSWVVAALAEAIAFAEPVSPWLVLRLRNPGVARWSGDPQALPARLLALVDARHTLGALADRLSLTPAQAAEAARTLVRAGLVGHQIDPPATTPDPLAFLVHRLAGLPGTGPLAAEVAALVELRDGFCADDADGKARRHRLFLDRVLRTAPDAAGGSGRTGAFYTDRLPLREECAGTVQLRLGGSVVRELRHRVFPALDFLAALAHRRRDLARHALAARLGERELPLWRLAARADGWPQPEDTEVAAAVRAAVADPDAAEVDLAASADLADLVRRTPLEQSGAVCSVDLLIAAADTAAWQAGRYEVLLGDVHDTVLLTDWALQFHPDAERVRTARDAAVAGAFGAVPAVSVLAKRQTGIPPLELPGPVVELGGTSGQGSPWLADLRDLVVVSDGTRVRLRSTPLGGEVALHNGELDTLVQTAFAPPRLRAPRIALGPHTPRLRWGAAVIQRESWTVPLSAVAALGPSATAAAVLAARRLWADHGLPEQAFVQLPGVRKPLFVDAASPALTRALARACRKVAAHTAPDAVVRISEMLPGPDELWLSEASGRYTAELRCVFARPARVPETPGRTTAS
ncbi:lantibiotic dehydratase family protein [Kitasatospora sp. NBC_00085]|uniref:lantibiotic dehydratase n=1 Tax=unclassified Kitasatospora TaxID=2633591 RepID=UPI003245E780